MVLLAGAEGPFCMHSHEVRLEGPLGNKDQGVAFPDGSTTATLSAAPGLIPSKGVSWYQAFAACERAGFHLCTSAEWEDGCDGQPGPGGRDYPTPDGAFALGICGLSGQGQRAWLSPGGSHPDCRTPEGVYDLLGNLWEWTDPGLRSPDGRPVVDKRGAAHYSAEPQTCAYGAVGSHDPAFDGTIGFRCCAAPLAAR